MPQFHLAFTTDVLKWIKLNVPLRWYAYKTEQSTNQLVCTCIFFLTFRVTIVLFLSSVLGETICIRYWEKCELVVDYAFVEKVQGSRKLGRSRWSCLLEFDRTLNNKRCINSMKHLESTLPLGQGRSLPPYCPLYDEMADWPTENLGWQKFALIILSFDQPGLQHLAIIH